MQDVACSVLNAAVWIDQSACGRQPRSRTRTRALERHARAPPHVRARRVDWRGWRGTRSTYARTQRAQAPGYMTVGRLHVSWVSPLHLQRQPVRLSTCGRSGARRQNTTTPPTTAAHTAPQASTFDAIQLCANLLGTSHERTRHAATQTRRVLQLDERRTTPPPQCRPARTAPRPHCCSWR